MPTAVTSHDPVVFWNHRPCLGCRKTTCFEKPRWFWLLYWELPVWPLLHTLMFNPKKCGLDKEHEEIALGLNIHLSWDLTVESWTGPGTHWIAHQNLRWRFLPSRLKLMSAEWVILRHNNQRMVIRIIYCTQISRNPEAYSKSHFNQQTLGLTVGWPWPSWSGVDHLSATTGVVVFSMAKASSNKKKPPLFGTADTPAISPQLI